MATEIKLQFKGRPLVQKNNIVIRQKQGKGRRIPFVAHTKALTDTRDKMALEFFTQYKRQGYTKPIDYLCEVDLVFYVTRQSEPDWDNLPGIVLDALQGYKLGKRKVAITLTDDKLVRSGRILKIVKGDPNYVGPPRTEICIRQYSCTSG